ncbi:hypothetical protein N9I83_01850 [bacterium]|nr:hypothetical protein [bacterium]
MADIDIQLEGQRFSAPAWATESTLSDMKDAIENLVGATDKQKDMMKKLSENTAEGNKNDAQGDKDLVKAIQNLDGDKGNDILFASSGSVGAFGGALKFAGASLSLFAGALLTMGKAIKGIGSSLQDSRGGTSLDLGGGGFSNAANFASSFQMLGYSADEVAQTFDEASGIIAISGRKNFMEMTSEIQKLTGAGSAFGLELRELGALLNEDLDILRQVGVLQQIDTMKQTKQSAQLYDMQLKATAILGKSIDEIRGATRTTLTDNASVSLLLQSMGPAAQDFTQSFKMMGSELGASGFSQGVNNAIQNAMLEVVAFRTDAGPELNKILQVIDGQNGTQLVGEIVKINALKEQGRYDEAEALIKAFPATAMAAIKGLGDTQKRQVRAIVENMGAIGQEMALAIGAVSQAGDAAEDVNQLAKASATVNNAFNKLNASVAGSINNVLAAFATPLSEIMAGFSDVTYLLDENDKAITDEVTGRRILVRDQSGVFAVLNDEMLKVMDAFNNLFKISEDGTSKVGDLSKMISSKLTPYITYLTDQLVTWINGFDEDKFSATIDKWITSFKVVIGLLDTMATALGWFVNLLVDTDTEVDPATGKKAEVFDLSGTIINAFLIAAAYSSVKSAFAGLFAGAIKGPVQSLGQKLTSKLFGGSDVGSKALKTGGKFGAGAVGMAAFGLAAAGVGVALLGISDSIETLGAMEWQDVAFGMGATAVSMGLLAGGLFLLAPAALAAAPGLLVLSAALLSVGVAAAGIGVAAGGISMLVDSFSNTADEEAMLLDNQTKNIEQLAKIDAGKLQSTASGIDAMASSMVAFGNATNDGWFSGPDLDDQYKQLDIFEKFAKLDGQGLLDFTSGMNELITTLQDLNALDTAQILSQASAVQKLNNAGNKGLGQRFMDGIGNIANRMSGSPDPSAASSNNTPGNENPAQEAEDKSVTGLLSSIVENTKKTKQAVEQLPKNMA